MNELYSYLEKCKATVLFSNTLFEGSGQIPVWVLTTTEWVAEKFTTHGFWSCARHDPGRNSKIFHKTLQTLEVPNSHFVTQSL
jgi:hypothetical protein